MQTTPQNIEQAIDDLISYYGPELTEVAERMSEAEFIMSTHMGAGSFARDSWCLWWRPGHTNAVWPQEKPALVQFFNNRGITEADDMSSIILASVYRSIKGMPVNLEGQISAYKRYWQDKGYPDGMPS